MELANAPIFVSIFALLVAVVGLFFRSPKEASKEAREEITGLWAAHNALAQDFSGVKSSVTAQHAYSGKELDRLTKAIEYLTLRIERLSDRLDGRSA